MQNEAQYSGIRLRFLGRLEATRIPMQIDVGFGDVVTPAPQPLLYPSILDLPDVPLRGYPPETVVAEKLETMIKRGMSNTRLKDFYDVWLLFDRALLDRKRLSVAIGNTFAARRTPSTLSDAGGLLREFGRDPAKQREWETFCSKHRLRDQVPVELANLTNQLAAWLQLLDE